MSTKDTTLDKATVSSKEEIMNVNKKELNFDKIEEQYNINKARGLEWDKKVKEFNKKDKKRIHRERINFMIYFFEKIIEGIYGIIETIYSSDDTAFMCHFSKIYHIATRTDDDPIEPGNRIERSLVVVYQNVLLKMKSYKERLTIEEVDQLFRIELEVFLKNRQELLDDLPVEDEDGDEDEK